MRYHYTYKITFYKEDKYYLGQHSTDNLDDNYSGSGTYCDWYFKKYGKNNTYKKEILAFYDSLDALNKAEYNLIGDKLCIAAKELKIDNGLIGAVCKGKRLTAGGYLWIHS